MPCQGSCCEATLRGDELTFGDGSEESCPQTVSASFATMPYPCLAGMSLQALAWQWISSCPGVCDFQPALDAHSHPRCSRASMAGGGGGWAKAKAKATASAPRAGPA